MNPKLTQLAERRRQLVAQAAAQRSALADNLAPWRSRLALVDRGVAVFRTIGRHPIEEALAQAEAISWRAPYLSGATLRKQINRQEVEYVDMHLSHLPQSVLSSFFGEIDLAVVEATEITPDGRVFLTTSIGASPTYLRHAKRVIIELNHRHSIRLREMADIMMMPAPPHRNPIPIYHPLDKIGSSFASVDPKKVIGVVENDEPDYVGAFDPPNMASKKIATPVEQFLVKETRVPDQP